MARPEPEAAAEKSPVGTTGHRDRATLGIALVVLSTVFLAGADVTAKYLAAILPALQIAWIRYAVFTAIVAGSAVWRQEGNPLRSHRPGLQLARGIGLVGSSLFFLTSLVYLPVAEATAISFISPIFVTALSIPLLGETIGWRRWLAALVGLGGVLIIVRPGTEAFQLASLLPILGALCWAASLIATRQLATTDSAATTMTYSALVGVVVLSVIVPFVWIPPTAFDLALGITVGLLSTAGHWIVAAAYRNAAASVLVPYSYTQIVWTSALGYLVFAAVPSVWTWTGAGVIIASSVYTAHRERVRAQEARRARTEPAPNEGEPVIFDPAAAAVDAALTSRRSVRAFRPDPVPRDLVEHLLDVAARAPSGTNMQPWRAYVLTGERKHRLSQALVAAHAAPDAPHEGEYRYYPERFPEPYLSRRRAVGWEMYGLLGIARGETEKMQAQHARNFLFFDAPVGFVFTIDRRLEIGSWLDYGMFLQALMTAARGHGLDTCAQAAFAPFHRVIREHVPITAEEIVVVGMALGYADEEAPVNRLRTHRESARTFATFLGEDGA